MTNRISALPVSKFTVYKWYLVSYCTFGPYKEILQRNLHTVLILDSLFLAFDTNKDKISHAFQTCGFENRARVSRLRSHVSDQLFNLRHIRLTRARVFTCRLREAEWADPREALQVKYQLNSLTALKWPFAIVGVLVQNECSDVKRVTCGAMIHIGSVELPAP